MRLNKCKSFHLREPIEFSWQVSSPTETLLLQELDKSRIEIFFNMFFVLIWDVKLCT